MRGGRVALLLESKGREGWQALTSSAGMSLLTLPEPDAAVLARRDEIIRQLKKLIAAPGLIVDREGCRTFETDALTAYRCIPLAVVLPASTEEVSSCSASATILGSKSSRVVLARRSAAEHCRSKTRSCSASRACPKCSPST